MACSYYSKFKNNLKIKKFPFSIKYRVDQGNVIFGNNITIYRLFLVFLHWMNQFHKKNHILNKHFHNLLYKKHLMEKTVLMTKE